MDVLSWGEGDLVFEPDHNVHGKRLFPWAGVDRPGWEAAWVVLSPHAVSTPHAHHENEVFFIVEGKGTMRIDDEVRPVGFGDTIFVTRGSEHELTNDADTRLVYLSVWWDPAADGGRAEAAERGVAGR
ncbi:mannose-6-phosphate isomerase-like protein (cupin superfamily) [Saccharothrix saharensis]|uniref:Mannose-6-phosphate isomerase-like protein (Cupin superfamily) n=1 Tax=Saccharothrix saharensis TaxID=571190 RepID=A0A543J7F2_9PSEU|nr:cupin domain-containing protein [Saccharothrix saharensis]TQM78756.1 mannose-6-phosphate isomerase-like protein (cupin superfamily) [Saccharothrix saharensis]